jgi:hypothetical protein
LPIFFCPKSQIRFPTITKPFNFAETIFSGKIFLNFVQILMYLLPILLFILYLVIFTTSTYKRLNRNEPNLTHSHPSVRPLTFIP